MKLCCTLALLMTVGVALPGQTFRGPKLVARLLGGGYSPTLTADGLTIYRTISRAGGLGGRDIWMTTRPTIASPWNATAINVTALNSPSCECSIDVRDDGLEMFISRQSSIWSATKTLAGWQPPTLATTAALNSTPNQHPTVTADGLEIYFSDSTRIYRAFRPSNTASWGAPTAVAELFAGPNGSASAPAISGDGLSLVYSFDDGSSFFQAIVERPDRGTPAAPTPFGPLALASPQAPSGQQTSDGFSYYVGLGVFIGRADRIRPVIYGPGGPPQVGQPFTIYVRRDAVAGQVGVIAGSTSKLPSPVWIPGVMGPLEINLAPGPLFWFTVGGVNSTDGKYTVNVPVPPIPALAGQNVHFQGAIQDPGNVWIGSSKKYTIAP